MYDQYGFDGDGFNKDGYNIYGFDKNGLNKDGLNKYGYKTSSGKGLSISSLPVLLSKIYTNNSSKELINEIKKTSKKITKQVDDDDDDDDTKTEYKKVVEDYRNNKIEYKEIKEKLNKTIDAIKIYKKNKNFLKIFLILKVR